VSEVEGEGCRLRAQLARDARRAVRGGVAHHQDEGFRPRRPQFLDDGGKVRLLVERRDHEEDVGVVHCGASVWTSGGTCEVRSVRRTTSYTNIRPTTSSPRVTTWR